MSRKTLFDRFKAAPVTILITALNVGVFLVVWMSAGMEKGSFSIYTLIEFGALERDHIWSGEYWRLATAMCLHVGIVHLLWNSYFMLGLNSTVERLFGSARFAMAYVLTGLGASAVSVISHTAVSAGASGAAFGMIGLLLCAMYRSLGSWKKFFGDRTVKHNLMIIVIWTVIGEFAGFDNYAHLGGLAFGFVLGFPMTTPKWKPGWGRRLGFLGFGVLLGTVLSASVRPRVELDPAYVVLMAEIRARKGQDEDTLRLLNKAEEAGYREHNLYFNRALAYTRLDRMEAAETDVTRSIEFDPESYRSYFLRAEIRAHRGNKTGAAADYRKALEFGPGEGEMRKLIEKRLKEFEESKSGESP